MNILYKTTMTNTGGRKGTAVSADGNLTFQMATPVEMGGDSAGTNPEQLFAATYSSCFGGALDAVLTQAHAQYESATVAAEISLNEDPADKSWWIGATLTVTIKGLSQEKAEKYVQMANKICPYSKAIKGNIDVKLVVVV